MRSTSPLQFYGRLSYKNMNKIIVKTESETYFTWCSFEDLLLKLNSGIIFIEVDFDLPFEDGRIAINKSSIISIKEDI